MGTFAVCTCRCASSVAFFRTDRSSMVFGAEGTDPSIVAVVCRMEKILAAPALWNFSVLSLWLNYDAEPSERF